MKNCNKTNKNEHSTCKQTLPVGLLGHAMVTVSPGLACGQLIFRLDVGEQKSSTSVVVGGSEAVDRCRNRLERLVLVAKVDVVTESAVSTSRVEDFFASYRVDPLVSCEAVSRNSVDMRLSGGKTGRLSVASKSTIYANCK